MSVYSLFNTSTLAMMSQAHSLNVIGQNIANVSTGGYKKTETEFRTVLSESLFQQSDLGGVRPKDLQRIDQQGQIVTSARDLDLAISGDGFFAVSPTLTVGSRIFFTRDGSFEISADNPTTTVSGTGSFTTYQGYLIDKNRNYLLGWSPNAQGVFTNTGTIAAMRVDPGAFQNVGQPSTTASLSLNLPANNAIIANHATAVTNYNNGTTTTGMEVYNIKVYDSNGSKQSVRLNFTKSAVNQWQMSTTIEQTPVKQVNTVTIAGAVEAGDTYTVTINGTPFVYAVTGGEGSLAAVRTNIVNLINADTSLLVTASAGAAAGAIVLTADTAGTSFTNTASATNGGATADNTATVAATTANVPRYVNSAATAITFTGFGRAGTAAAGQPDNVTPPNPVSLSLSFGAFGSNPAGTASVSLNISGLTQFAGGFLPVSYTVDGFEKSSLIDVTFESAGHVIGRFESGDSRPLYKIPLALFNNPNGLEMRNGMSFAETEQSGTYRYVAADVSNAADFLPNAHELSNVDIAEEFTRMILTQQAYNSAATVFRTVDEMTVVARDLKR